MKKFLEKIKSLFKKIDLSNKKINLCVTLTILVIVMTIGVLCSIDFVEFRNFETEFYIREDVVGRIYKFSEFSKHLEGDVADSNIYEIQGTDNTVAVVKKSKASEYSTIEAIKNLPTATISGTEQATKATETMNNLAEVSDVDTAIAGLKNGTFEAAVMAYKDAQTVVKANDDLEISEAVVEKVPSILVIGGTHPNEPSGQLTATLFLENALVKRGILYVITELNRSAYSYSQPQEATTWYYTIKTANGTRTFKYGSRATNTVDQWPTPDVYTHSSGQQLSSSEVRNINRAYPGSEEGTYTEQIAYAVTNFVNQKDVTIVIDLHEASPEYLTIDACVYHQDAGTLIAKQGSAKAFRYTDSEGASARLNIAINQSPENMHGLTHRELGDYTNAYVFLFETSNASQGKIRGAFTEELIKYSYGDKADGYEDKFYEALVAIDEANVGVEGYSKLIYGRPVSISERVARHTLSITSVIAMFNKVKTTRLVEVTAREDQYHTGGVEIGEFIMVDNSIPTFTQLTTSGIGAYLKDIN